MIHRIVAPLTLVALSLGSAQAQSAFPAPLPGQQMAPLAFRGAMPIGPACVKEFGSLREEAEKRGREIKAAGARHAPPGEACKLIASYSEAEVRVIEYVEANTVTCGMPAQITDQLKSSHQNTEALEKKICNLAEQMQKRSSGLSGVFGPAYINDLGDPAMKPWRE
jgi:hypothetical protein